MNMTASQLFATEVDVALDSSSGGAPQRPVDLAEARKLAIKAKLIDDPSGESACRVARLAGLLAFQLHGDAQMAAELEEAALFYDIGKVTVPQELVSLQGPLSDVQMREIQNHTVAGAAMLQGFALANKALAMEIARDHHERWDGCGYPNKRDGRRVPVSALIVGLADAFDAMTHRRPYKAAWSIDAALAEIHALKGLFYSPQLVDALIVVVAALRREARNSLGNPGGDGEVDAFVLRQLAIGDRPSFQKPL